MGSSLLEVLITILILSLGLLGVAGMTVKSLQSAKTSQYQSIGVQLVNEYADRMRGNTVGVANDEYIVNEVYTGAPTKRAVPSCAIADACTSAEIANIDQVEWLNAILQRLPAGAAYVSKNNTLSVDIWLIWMEPDMNFDANSTLAVGATGGSRCPNGVLSVSGNQVPRCMYFRVSI